MSTATFLEMTGDQDAERETLQDGVVRTVQRDAMEGPWYMFQGNKMAQGYNMVSSREHLLFLSTDASSSGWYR